MGTVIIHAFINQCWFSSLWFMLPKRKLKNSFGLFLVLIGSVAELPAETCKEIKASDGERATSGKYWFDSLLPGEVIQAECNMETEGNLHLMTFFCLGKETDDNSFVTIKQCIIGS